MLRFHKACPCGFRKCGLGGNLFFQLGNGACLTVTCCGNLEVLDVSPMFQAGAVGKFVLGGVNKIFLRIIFDNGLFPDGERHTLFVLCKSLFLNAFFYPFLGVFGSQRLCAATDKTLSVQRAEGDKFMRFFPGVMTESSCSRQRSSLRRLFKNNAIGIWVLAGESIEEWLKIKGFKAWWGSLE